MPVIKLENFQGALENANPRLIPDNMGASARNVDFSQRRLEAGYSLEDIGSSPLVSEPLPSTVPSCAEYITDSPVIDDKHDRLYYLCDGELSVSTPTKSKRSVGVPVPTGDVLDATVDNSHLFNVVTKTGDGYPVDLGATPTEQMILGLDQETGEYRVKLVDYAAGTSRDFTSQVIDVAIGTGTINPRSAAHVKVTDVELLSSVNSHKWVVYSEYEEYDASSSVDSDFQMRHKESWAAKVSTLLARGLVTLDSCGDLVLLPSAATIKNNAEVTSDEFNSVGINILPAQNVSSDSDVLGDLRYDWSNPVGVVEGATNVSDLKGDLYRVTYEYPEYDSALVEQERYYAFSFVSDMDEEGPLVSAHIVGNDKIFDGSRVTFTAKADNASYEGGVYTLRVYRAYDGDWRFVGDVELSDQGDGTFAATGTDALYDYQLGEVAPSADWEMPPSNVRGLLRHTSGSLCLWKENDLHFSEPYLPHAWPPFNRVSLEDEIVSVHQTRNGLIVTTNGAVYTVSGAQPASVQPVKVDTFAPNIYQKAAVDMGEFVVYLTNDGLVKTDGFTVQPFARDGLPKKVFTGVESGDAIRFDERYVILVGQTLYIVAPDETVSTVDATGVDLFEFEHYERYADAIRLVVDDGADKLISRNTDTGSFYWKSKRFRLPSVRSLSSIKVVAESTGTGEVAVTIRGFVGHQESYVSAHDVTIGSDDPMFFDGARLSPGIFDEFQVEVFAPDGSGAHIDAIILGNSMAEVRNA